MSSQNNMIKKIKSWLNVLALTAVLIVPGLVFAGDPTLNEKVTMTKRLKDVAVTYGPFSEASNTSLATTLGLVIAAALSLLGIIFLIITILAGYKWMMAQGNEAEVEKAKSSITRAVVGLLVTISAWAIWYFISANFLTKV
jgi:small-conductance mechanosensitive channel